MSGKVLAGIDSISHDPETVRVRLDGSGSVNQIEISKNWKFVADDVFYAELNEFR